MMNKIDTNVIICGVIKNCSNTLQQNIDLAIETGELFHNYKIIIYENNSTDETKYILDTNRTNSNIHIISEDIDPEYIKKTSRIWAYTEITGSDHPCRIEQICNARNKVIDEINKPDYDIYNYIIWIDMDSDGGWKMKGIKDSFDKKEQWDVVYANGIRSKNNLNYYDLYAFRSPDYLYGPEIIGEHFWNNLSILTFNMKDGLIPIYSGFGGIGVFKKDIFKCHRYDCLVNDSVKIFYRKIFDTTLPEYKSLIENNDTKFPDGYKDEETNIFWKSNSGYNKPVICEHVPLNLELINKGYRILLNPKMIYIR